MRDTEYATLKAEASDQHGQTIERLHIKGYARDEIRFSWWKDGKLVMRPLDLPENELLPLIQAAVAQGVFTDRFLDDLRDFLVRRRD